MLDTSPPRGSLIASIDGLAAHPRRYDDHRIDRICITIDCLQRARLSSAQVSLRRPTDSKEFCMLRKQVSVLALAATLLLPQAAYAFKLSSNELQDGGRLAPQHVLNGFGCAGENRSPHLAWDQFPEGTKSFVVTVYTQMPPRVLVGGIGLSTTYRKAPDF
jgi:hypothetical protein